MQDDLIQHPVRAHNAAVVVPNPQFERRANLIELESELVNLSALKVVGLVGEAEFVCLDRLVGLGVLAKDLDKDLGVGSSVSLV